MELEHVVAERDAEFLLEHHAAAARDRPLMSTSLGMINTIY